MSYNPRGGLAPPGGAGGGAPSTCGDCGMAELALSPAAVLGFLRERGGWVRNAELRGAFRPLLEAAGDAAERAERRELFKRSVNAVATVKERDGAKFVVLKRHLRLPPPPGGVPMDGGGTPPQGRLSPSPPEELPSPRAVSELRGIFQRSGGGGVPLPAGGSGSRREPVPKPCMLPVRCVPSPAAAPEQPKEPGAALSPLPEEDEAGCRSPNLRRVSKTLRASEEPAAVPLEEAEHRWLVMAAEGQWSQQLHGLLLGDASLAARRDFISGFTALHWAAKNGNCDMVRNIIEVAQKEGTHVDVDARSHGGYTALHLAAMHGQETVISMLVRSYHAKTDLRDYSGKKPHQCLREGASIAIRRLLGDPSLEITGGSSLPMKKSTKIAASILSSTSTFLGVISDDMAFYDLTKGLRKPSSLNKLLAATTGPRRKPKTRGGFPSYCSLSEVVEEEEQEEVVVKRRPVSELFFGH
ncbi:ankyrin repeat domain-containing protein SOWAHA [Aythya fuligula]|uniref:Ankyrin repeat domain-containing protein SOWAHA n=1 Tax=Aythya fuligula TaxID=219594 RepID=A0A6J3DTS8_AYTFU|nr:ankyrin repeat domain-containing protein SOWAHA [Aythya fuligula]